MESNLKTTLHITFGLTGMYLISKSRDAIASVKDTICFEDPLSIGPLCDLNDDEGTERRKWWFKEILESSESENLIKIIEKDLLSLDRLVSTAANYQQIYFWLGDEASEKITAARALHHLQGLDVPVFKSNLAKAGFRSKDGKKTTNNSLTMMSFEYVPEAFGLIEPLDDGDKRSLVSLWRELLADDSVVRLADKEGFHLTDETFVDGYLLNRCTDQNQHSTIVVGYTLMDIWDDFGFHTVGESLLFHRLNVLAKMGKLEITERRKDEDDTQGSLRNFKVRHAQGVH